MQHKAQAIEPAPRSDNPPLSFGQERLWFVDQLDSDSTVHNLRSASRLTGRLDIPVLERSLRAIRERHEILRTVFPAVDGQPVQRILPSTGPASGELPLPVVELTGVSGEAREEEIRRLATAEAQRPFDLARGPLMRARLLRLSEDEYVLLLTCHHMITDRWSNSLLMRELAAHYRAFSGGGPLSLPDLPIQYADFAEFQRRWLQGAVLEGQLDYWRAQLGGDPPVLALPTDYPTPATATHQGAARYLELPEGLITALKGLGYRRGVSLFIVLLAAFKALLYRYSGQSDLMVCSPVAGRYRVETKKLIGYFSNLVLLRTDSSGDPGFSTLLERVSETVLGANEHQDLPFQQLADTLKIPGVILSRALFSLQNVPSYPLALSEGVGIEPLDIEEGIANFDLFLSMKPKEKVKGEAEDERKGEGMICVLRYKTALFASSTMERMLENFQSLLEAVAAEPERRLSGLPAFGSDRTRDPARSPGAPAPEAPGISPRNETEKTIASIWQEVLKKNNISIDANFFDIGGRSLAMMPICMKLQDILKRDIPVAELFKHPTIAGMAAYINGITARKAMSSSQARDRTQKQRAVLAQQQRLNRIRRKSNG